MTPKEEKKRKKSPRDKKKIDKKKSESGIARDPIGATFFDRIAPRRYIKQYISTQPSLISYTMGKRKQLKDGDVVMGGADPTVEGDESDEVRRKVFSANAIAIEIAC